MSEKQILVIDDSATIRKLVDTHLSSEGYTVLLAASAEEGLSCAEERQPDLIILDHQLPGTTGYEVCQRLLASQQLRHIPVVASSTLRKKAYVEYTDCDNVVDMLPKPYSEELLKTTIANALETAAMIVESQSQGTAVPEVMFQSEDADLAGRFGGFGLREVLDFLNNGGKRGSLEVEADRMRLWFYLDKGRIQGVSAKGITDSEIEELVQRLPQSLTNLSAVLKLTIGGRGSAEIDGFVQLLDQKVLDPRLTAKLLRFQAAMLLRLAFSRQLKSFQFHSGNPAPALHRDLPIDNSLLALLVEQAMHCDLAELPVDDDRSTYVRRSIRGQNLDRTGLAARHMKILNLLSEPQTCSDLASKLGWEQEEVRRVLHGFVLAELVEQRRESSEGTVVVFESDPGLARQSRASLENAEGRYAVKVVRDPLALQLLLKRSNPTALVFAADDDGCCNTAREMFPRVQPSVRRIAVCNDDGGRKDWTVDVGFVPDSVLPRPYTAEQLFRTLDELSANQPAASPATSAPSATSVAPASNQSIATPIQEATH